MNLVKVADDLKNLSDQQLAGLMQQPSGMAPEYLVLTEMKRREKVRNEFAAQGAEPPPTTIAEEAVIGATAPAMPAGPEAGGIASLGPQEPQQFSTGGSVWGSTAPWLMSRLQQDFNLAPHQAAGIVGNLGYESGGFEQLQEIKPLVPGSRGGYGWAQWTGPRRRAFEAWAAQQGLDPSSKEANYGFLKHELTSTPEGRVLDRLRGAKTASEAAMTFSDGFLRPGIVNMDKRIAWTQKALGQGGDLDPSAAAASYNKVGSSKPTAPAAGIESLMAFTDDGEKKAADDPFAGISSILAQGEAKKQAEFARQKELAMAASQPAPVEQLDPMDFMPEKRAGKFAEGGAVWPGDRHPPLLEGLPSTEEFYQNQPEAPPMEWGNLDTWPLLGPAREWVRENIKKPADEARKRDKDEKRVDEEAAKSPASDAARRAAKDMPVPSAAPSTAAATNDVPADPASQFTGSGIGAIVEMLRQGRPDPYAGLQEQIDALGQGGLDPQRQKWMDLARFGFALAATGNAGEAGMAMIQARDEANSTAQAIKQKQLELNARLMQARAAADQGDWDTAAEIYLAQLKGGTPAGLKPNDAMQRIAEIRDEVDKLFDNTEVTSPYYGLPPEQITALKEAEFQRRWKAAMAEAGVQPGAAAGADFDVAD